MTAIEIYCATVALVVREFLTISRRGVVLVSQAEKSGELFYLL